MVAAGGSTAVTPTSSGPRTGPRLRARSGVTSTSTPSSTASPGWPTPSHFPTRKGATAAAFLARAKVWFAAHGITHLHRIITDNGACYRSNDFARIVGHRTRHHKTKPFTPQHNGKAERYQRIITEEVLYAREFSCEPERSAAIAVWNIHYNYHRPHNAAGGRPPASRLHTGVTNVRPSYI